MDCPQCAYHNSKVVDSRDVGDGIRRRRECLQCGFRFTTFERVNTLSMFVIKKDERREEFRRDKLLSGILKACEKRPLPTGTVEKVVDDIEALMSRLSAAGYEAADDSALDDHPHRRRVYYIDGNGLDWEFVEYRSEVDEERNDYSL